MSNYALHKGTLKYIMGQLSVENAFAIFAKRQHVTGQTIERPTKEPEKKLST